MDSMTYVLVTAARNEEAYIEKTIKAIISQTKLPARWVIVSDGSTDLTDEIIRRYIKKNDFISLICREGDIKPNFGSQVRAINTGLETLKTIAYDFIGNLDADVSFDHNYYENLLKRFMLNPKLGLAGGFIYERRKEKFSSREFNNVNSVAHAIQLFRRECYDATGGYVPLPYGGPDWVAEVMARMKGWEVQAFPDLKVYHHKHGAKVRGRMKDGFRQGLMDYSVGSHPLFEGVKCLRRAKEKSYLVISFCRMAGFIWACCRGGKRPVSSEFIRYLRKEQMDRLRTYMANIIKTI
jgi:glycosyltransferase involved in cell wall biosynthesis